MDLVDSVPREKTIKDIEPYNVLHYKNCYYNSFFPIMFHFKKNIVPFLVSDLIHYEYQPEVARHLLDVKYEPIHTNIEVIEDLGLICRYQNRSDRILEDIITALANDKPVFILEDPFYQAARSDYYQKVHWLTTLLFYGYDNSRQLFQVIDREFKETLSYKKSWITYTDTMNLYYGYLEYYVEERVTYYDFQERATGSPDPPEQVLQKYISDYFHQMLQRQDLILGGLDSLKHFSANITALFMNETELSEKLETLLEMFNQVINFKRVENYRNLQLFGDSFPELVVMEPIINQWVIIRVVLTKYLYSQKYRPASFNNLADNLEQIYQLECRYYETLFQVIEKKAKLNLTGY